MYPDRHLEVIAMLPAERERKVLIALNLAVGLTAVAGGATREKTPT